MFCANNECVCTDASKVAVETDTDAEDDGAPTVSLQEMLEDLHISHDATGADGDPMMEWCWQERRKEEEGERGGREGVEIGEGGGGGRGRAGTPID